MTELPPHLTALLESARKAHEPSDADRERVFGGLQIALGAAAASVAISQTSAVAAGAAGTPSLVPGATSAAGFAAKWWVLGALAVSSSGIWAWWPESGARTDAPIAEHAATSSFAAAELAAPQRDRQSAPKLPPSAVSAAMPMAPAREPVPTPVATVEARADAPALRSPEATLAETPQAQPSLKPARTVTRKAPGSVHSGSGPSVTKSESTSPIAAPEVQGNLLPSNALPTNPSNQGELALVRATLTALRDRRAHDALTLLDEHARQYPQGAMAHERNGLRVVALCDAGQRERGLREQSAFLRADSSSALAQRVRHACPAGEAR